MEQYAVTDRKPFRTSDVKVFLGGEALAECQRIEWDTDSCGVSGRINVLYENSLEQFVSDSLEVIVTTCTGDSTVLLSAVDIEILSEKIAIDCALEFVERIYYFIGTVEH